MTHPEALDALRAMVLDMAGLQARCRIIRAMVLATVVRLHTLNRRTHDERHMHGPRMRSAR